MSEGENPKDFLGRIKTEGEFYYIVNRVTHRELNKVTLAEWGSDYFCEVIIKRHKSDRS